MNAGNITGSAYIEFQLNVPLEQCLFWTHPNSSTEYLPGSRQIQSPNLKLGKQKPQFRKGKNFVGNKLDGRLVYLTGSFIVLRKISSRVSTVKAGVHTLVSISSNNA